MICETDSSDFGTLTVFQTLGCGQCMADYCISNQLPPYPGSYIRQVKVGPLDNVSGSLQYGWDYRHFSGAIQTDELFRIGINVYSEFGFTLNASVFIDWNQDGDFLDFNELVWNYGNITFHLLSNTPWLGVPPSAVPGCTRLRIIAAYQSINSSCQPPVSSSTEDYCLCISEGISTGIEPLLESSLKLYPNPTADDLTIDFEESSFDNMANSQLLLYNNMGQIVLTKSLLQSSTSLYLGFLPSGYYHALVLQDKKPLLRKPVIISK